MSQNVSFVGPDQVERYRAIVLASGLKLYAKTGMRPNRAYTPTAMMREAARITGKRFKPRAYLEAARQLELWVQRTANVPFDPPYTVPKD